MISKLPAIERSPKHLCPFMFANVLSAVPLAIVLKKYISAYFFSCIGITEDDVSEEWVLIFRKLGRYFRFM